MRRTPVDRKIAFLRSTGVLRFFVGLHTFFVLSWGTWKSSVGDKKRGDQTKVTLPSPPPLLSPLAASRPQPPPNIAPVSAISPPRHCRSPSSTTTAPRCDSSGVVACRVNVAPPFPRPCSLVLSSRHCRCRRCRRCCRRHSSLLLPLQ